MKCIPCHHLPATAVIVLSILLSFTACQKHNPPQSSAKGSLVSDGVVCYPYTVHGAFYNDIPSVDSDYVEIRVNVTSPGSYRITTDQQQGVSFSASGIFSDTGLMMVRMKPTGVFTGHTDVNYITSFDSTHCQFTVHVTDSAALSIADNTWEFTAGGHYYHGTVVGVVTHQPEAQDHYAFYGSMQGFTDTSLTIRYVNSGLDSVFTCTRPTSNSDNNVNFYTSRYYTGPPVHLSAFFNKFDIGAFIDIKICSDVIRFDGNAIDANNNVVLITNARMRCSNVRDSYGD